jgi:hypothetical protein
VPGGGLVIVSVTCEYGLGRFGPWRVREPAISETIASIRPDVPALQESWSTRDAVQADVFVSRHELVATFAASHMPVDPDPRIELGLAVPRRWPMSAAKPIRLPTGEGLATVALLVDVHHPEGILHFMTACLDWEEGRQEHRLHQARELLGILTSSELDGPLPVVHADRRIDYRRPGEPSRLPILLRTCAMHGPTSPARAGCARLRHQFRSARLIRTISSPIADIGWPLIHNKRFRGALPAAAALHRRLRLSGLAHCCPTRSRPGRDTNRSRSFQGSNSQAASERN